MNSMNKKIFNEIKAIFKNIEFTDIDERKYSVIIPKEKAVSFLETLKRKGFSHMSLITCIDWIAEKEFEIVYTLFNWETGTTLMVKTRVDRDNPILPTVMEIWPTAKYYERDIHEFFGVKFEGNPDLRPLILEKWEEIPPMRKDFDSAKYSKEHFPDRAYDVDFLLEGSESNE
ncbi:NADH dehydrogenase [Kosmotoga arenicorallina S304]|uniref:NADH dehydrogenase n=1 Tax=Kosmotoga arenicorallina S304 TaxID=1453497 RepID=A0A176JXH3_9BACT|nr:NADH-quinone oxidoreductase subunit C [Kosmotoga arenicorallina]OAA28420.1 NADH dehydrogenase [Kosmotoga arenicorallina S304]